MSMRDLWCGIATQNPITPRPAHVGGRDSGVFINLRFSTCRLKVTHRKDRCMHGGRRTCQQTYLSCHVCNVKLAGFKLLYSIFPCDIIQIPSWPPQHLVPTHAWTLQNLLNIKISGVFQYVSVGKYAFHTYIDIHICTYYLCCCLLKWVKKRKIPNQIRSRKGK